MYFENTAFKIRLFSKGIKIWKLGTSK